MNAFNFYTPTEIVFGKDSEKQAGAKIKAIGKSNVLVIYGGGSVMKNGIMDRVVASLSEAGLEYLLVGGVQANPLLSYTLKLVQTALEAGADFILAVGGGSVIDTAKAVALGAGNPEEELWSFFTGEKKPKTALPVGVVLTISAAGSETSESTVQTNDLLDNIKRGAGSIFNRPRFALMNPEATFTLPKYQVACGVVDIMMHTLDRYFVAPAFQGNELTDQIAEALLRTTIQYGIVAVKDPHDYQAESELMWAGSLSHNGLTGLGGPSDFAPHQLGHELSGKYDVAHGASLSAVWNAWANDVCASDPARFARYARKVWELSEPNDALAAAAGIAKTVDYFRSLGMPVTIGELKLSKVTDEDLRQMSDKCTNFGKRTIGNIRILDGDDIYRIFKAAL